MGIGFSCLGVAQPRQEPPIALPSAGLQYRTAFPDEMSPGGTMTTTIICHQCGGQLGLGDRFCAQCGAELLWCAICGEFLLQTEECCPKCGTPGIPRPESHTIPYELSEADSPWAEVVARLRRATLGEFEIGHELGRGGMAAVFLAHEL